ncbi:hypothetical protein F0L68_40160 [Solihabitans fulvus]|uniref:Uncharacterized protein n=1 Tax=Solihabitans fulvus TaxID=1892852 RepID=A0A5B2W8Z2_9PSEU|nr:hypothetical protein F0L68_40160 [Solihabitans fulvus]
MSLFQCPATACNQGVANEHFPTRDALTDICYLPYSGGNGDQDWNLVLNYANNEVGFVRGQWLDGTHTSQTCGGAGAPVTSGVPTLSLFQCPATFCNQGVANQHLPTRDALTDICYLPYSGGNGDQDWNLVLNYANNEVGFVRGQWLEGTHTNQTC